MDKDFEVMLKYFLEAKKTIDTADKVIRDQAEIIEHLKELIELNNKMNELDIKKLLTPSLN
jgi:hypothetical protein